MFSFFLLKRALSYTSLLVLASLGCAQESFAMDTRSTVSSTYTIFYLNSLKKELRLHELELNAAEKDEYKKIINKFNKIINNSSPKSLRLPIDILNNYLENLSQVFGINESSLSERVKGLLWKPLDLLSPEERIIKARSALDEFIRVLKRVTPEKQFEFLKEDNPILTSYNESNADEFTFNFMSDASSGNADGSMFNFMSNPSPDDDFKLDFMPNDPDKVDEFANVMSDGAASMDASMSEFNRKEAANDALKHEIIKIIEGAKKDLDQESDIENVLQNLMIKLKEEFPTSTSLFDSIGNPDPLTYFQKHTFPTFLALCDAINISAYCSLEIKEESKYESVENNLNLLITHLNYNDQIAQYTRAQALYLKAELHRLRENYKEATQLYNAVIGSSSPRFLSDQALFWLQEMKCLGQVDGHYRTSSMRPLAYDPQVPFVIRSKAHLRCTKDDPASLRDYIGWIAQPLTKDINEFELNAYEKILDSSLKAINPFKPIEENTQDTWGEIFLLKLEAIYRQITIKLSDYRPDSLAQQKYTSQLCPLAYKIAELHTIRQNYVNAIERFGDTKLPIPRTEYFLQYPIDQYKEEDREEFFEDLRDNYKFLKNRRFEHLSDASQLKILTRLNRQLNKAKVFTCMRDIYKQQSGETTFQRRKGKEHKEYFQEIENKIKNEISKENCRKIIRDIPDNEGAVTLLYTAQQELETKKSGFDNFMQTLADKLRAVLPESLLLEEVNPSIIYQKIKDDNKEDFEKISRLFSSYKKKLSDLSYDVFAPKDQIACLLEELKSELQSLTSIRQTAILTQTFPKIQWGQRAGENLDSEQRVQAFCALTRMDQLGQGRERPKGDHTVIEIAREKMICQAFEKIIQKAPSEALKSKARFSQLEMYRMGQIEDAVLEGHTLEENYKMLLQNECSEKLKTQIKATLAELHDTDCVNIAKRNQDYDKKLRKAYKTFHSIIYTPSLPKEIKMQGDAGLAKIIHYFPEWSIQNIPQFLRDKYIKKISYAREVIDDTLKEAEEIISQIFPMDFKGMMALGTMETMRLFPQYSQRTAQELPKNPEEIRQKLIELDESPKVFPWLKTEVNLWLAKFAYHGYGTYHHSWDYALFLFRKIRENPEFTPDQQAIAELYLAQIYRLGIPGKEAYEPMINAFEIALRKTTSEKTKLIAKSYLKCIKEEQERVTQQEREKEKPSRKRSGDDNIEEQSSPKRLRLDSLRRDPEDKEKPMNID